MIITNDFFAANFTFDQPFQLKLAEEITFRAEKILRIMPGKRLVAFGSWQGQSVVAKLFFDPKRAKQHVEKELAGIKILEDNKIPTPSLLYHGVSLDQRCYVLLFERIFDAKHIDEIWQEKASLQEIMPQLRLIMIELATQHVLGVLQHDLHLNNFLLKEKIIYTLDGAQIELLPKMLQGKASLNHLALFLSQLGAGAKIYQEALFRSYAKARGWLVKKDDLKELFSLIKKWNHERWANYKKKIVRDSSQFANHKDWSSISVYDRAYAAPQFLKLMSDPESAFRQANLNLLKAGRSSTVIKITLDQRDFVVKRYNIKGIWHYLRRCLRPTRAFASWQLAQKLKLFHVATAAPAGFVERRFLGLRGKSYYVTEYVAGENLSEFFSHSSQIKKRADMIKKVTALLKNLSFLGITHGDLKATNILINSNEFPLFIDLDGAAEHTSSMRLRKAWRKEIKRFLENFSGQSMQEAFQQELKYE